MKVITTEKIPVKIWSETIEEGALAQAKNLANLPFAFKHVAIMPDCHQGYGMPIGGVLATKGVIIPNAVGVDIGCGMCAVRTSLKEINKETLKRILSEIRQTVPVGFEHHRISQNEKYMPESKIDRGGVVEREYEKALTQVGTLGGGNHFIEIQKGDDGYIWIMIHSGSRNIGKQVADYYNRLAFKISQNPNQLSCLDFDSEEGQKYFKEMNYCVDFALANRKLMMERTIEIIKKNIPGTKFDPMINIAHNYASLETHFGQQVLVHRKGATLAKKGLIGIIPGSQGTESYIVEGLGNIESFQSCSHGAGRKMSRGEARRTLNLEEEKRRLEAKGILHGIRSRQDLDEASSAYKPIEEVIKNQEDLVLRKVKLTPLAVIKG